MAKNKGFETKATKYSKGFDCELKIQDEIIESIPVDEIDPELINKEAFTTEEALELESKKILKHNQQKNMGYIMDAKYYFTVYFICEEDKLEFYEKAGISDMHKVFINGYEFAKKFNIKIEKKLLHLPVPKSLKI